MLDENHGVEAENRCETIEDEAVQKREKGVETLDGKNKLDDTSEKMDDDAETANTAHAARWNDPTAGGGWTGMQRLWYVEAPAPERDP